MVGYGRLSGGQDVHSATLCEVVVIGREFVGQYMVYAQLHARMKYCNKVAYNNKAVYNNH